MPIAAGKRVERLTKFLVCVLTVFGASVSSISTAQAEIVERIVAIVNNEIITQTDLDRFSEKLRSGGLVDDLLVADAETRDALMKDRDKLLQKMIDERLIDSEIKRQNMQVPIERVEQELREIAKRNGISREDLQRAVTREGVSFSQYQDFIKTGLERQSLIEKSVAARIKITEQDVLNAYAQNTRGAGTQAFEYTLAHSLFLKEKGGIEEAKSQAQFFLKRLSEGGNFEKLAGEMSQDPNFSAGGLLGTFRSGEFIPELEAAVKSLQPGQLSGVVETKNGFHVLKVLAKKLIPDPRYEQEKAKIHQSLYDQAYRRQIQSWLEQLRQDAFIRINSKS